MRPRQLERAAVDCAQGSTARTDSAPPLWRASFQAGSFLAGPVIAPFVSSDWSVPARTVSRTPDQSLNLVTSTLVQAQQAPFNTYSCDRPSAQWYRRAYQSESSRPLVIYLRPVAVLSTVASRIIGGGL